MELGVGLQAASVLKADDGNHCTCNLGGLWGDYNDDHLFVPFNDGFDNHDDLICQGWKLNYRVNDYDSLILILFVDDRDDD